jgi:hypothetical protein
MINQTNVAKSLLDSWLTIKLLAEAEPAFTQPALRYHVFNADDRQSSHGIIPGNGLGPHIRRIGSKVLINHGGFLSWIDEGAKNIPERPNSKIEAEENAPLVKPVELILPDGDVIPKSKQSRRRRP